VWNRDRRLSTFVGSREVTRLIAVASTDILRAEDPNAGCERWSPLNQAAIGAHLVGGGISHANKARVDGYIF
jgi:hypothetical protein